MPVSIISRTSKAKNMKKLRKKILVLEIVWNQPIMIIYEVFLIFIFSTVTFEAMEIKVAYKTNATGTEYLTWLFSLVWLVGKSH